MRRQKRGAVGLLMGLVLGGTGSAQVAAIDTPVKDPWAGTGLDFSFIEQRLGTDACYGSEARFLSCMSSVQRLLERSPRQLDIVLDDPADPAGNYIGSIAVVQFGPLAVVRKSTVMEQLDVAREVRARRERLDAWSDLYHTRSDHDIDFTQLRKWLMSEIVEPGQEASYAAAAINGYLSIEDAHAKIMPATLINGEQVGGAPGEGRDGNGTTRYSGIGVALELVGGTPIPIVTRVMPGSPADQAGLKQHDLLLTVDGEPFASTSMDSALNRLRGPEGTSLALTFRRGDETHRVEVVRGEIAVQNVIASVVEDRAFNWGYIKVHSFVAPNTCREFGSELEKLLEAQVSGLILDVRNNAGGRIDQAVCIADLFLDANQVVLEMRSTQERRRPHTLRTRFHKRTGLPLVTLVNAGTGSASEVLAGALRDHRRSLLLGERTFGKGTIQTTRPFDRSGSIMQFTTTARYYLPSGSSVQRVGIEPDFHVPQQPELDEQNQLVLRLEDLYPTTLPESIAGPAISRAAPEQLSLTCLTGDSGAQHRVDDAAARLADYPLYRASEVLGCML